MRGRIVALLAIAAMLLFGCTEVTIEDETPDVITIVEEIWHTTVQEIWHTTTVVETVIEEDSTPDVIENWHFEYPSGPVPCMVLEEGGVPAMADQPLSGLTEATTIALADLMLLTQSGTSKKIAFKNVPFPTNHIAGLILSMNGSDPDADVDVAVGSCRDAGDTANMRLAAGLTKQLDAAWAVGTNQGGLDTGAIAADTLYAVWLIERSDTEVVDVLFSASFSSPTMPTNYDLKRLIGAVRTDSSSDIVAFLQSGDDFVYLGNSGGSPPIDVNDGTLTHQTWKTGTLTSVPPLCMAHVVGFLQNPTSTSPADGSWDIRARPPSSWSYTATAMATAMVNANFDYLSASGYVMVDASKQVDYVVVENAGSAAFIIQVRGFRMLTRRDPQ